MGVGLVLRDKSVPTAIALAEVAEEAGLEVVFVPETGNLPSTPLLARDPFAVCGAMLAATTRLRCGTGVAVTPFRPARQMALAAATLDEASEGRFVLGIGVSHADLLRSTGNSAPRSPMAHLREYLHAMKATRESLGYGRDWPTVIGALGPRMTECGATDADGVLLNWMTAGSAKEIVDRLVPLSPTPLLLGTFARIGPRPALLADARLYHDTLENYRRHFARQGLHDPEAIVDATSAAPEPGAVHDLLDRLGAAGITHPCLYPVGMEVEEVTRLLARLDLRRDGTQPPEGRS
jgi:alkanesulfonate monooxygenase SsuD/methylene tetrahydromethanopterin reductase-like flavin-dependent oxidoreductase (luciferase family)